MVFLRRFSISGLSYIFSTSVWKHGDVRKLTLHCEHVSLQACLKRFITLSRFNSDGNVTTTQHTERSLSVSLNMLAYANVIPADCSFAKNKLACQSFFFPHFGLVTAAHLVVNYLAMLSHWFLCSLVHTHNVQSTGLKHMTLQFSFLP